MLLRYSQDWEDVLNVAAKDDERLSNFWLECVGDGEYATLLEFFAKENYPHYDDFDELVEVNTSKELQKILRGKDRIALIDYAFMLGQLVGRAAHIMEGSS